MGRYRRPECVPSHFCEIDVVQVVTVKGSDRIRVDEEVSALAREIADHRIGNGAGGPLIRWPSARPD